MPGTEKGVHIIACCYVVQGPRAPPGHMWPPLPVIFLYSTGTKFQVPGTTRSTGRAVVP